ncbi:MAG: Cupredoxin-like domain [Actinomycetota bacterium]|nr:Cupredoxin-like domain [Actinomycetota bacterium]MEA2550966.1 Cupredoxin-like domain [Actinomycetota bacterium]
MKRATIALSVGLVCLLVACSASGGPSRAPQPLPIVQQPDNPAVPYGITAIDYHFHDTHPSLPLTADRTVLWTNQGQVLHNVTIPELNFSKDIAPGEGFAIKDLGRKLGGEGVYTFFCAYHESVGMTGVIVIRGRSSVPSVPPSLLPPSYSPISIPPPVSTPSS